MQEELPAAVVAARQAYAKREADKLAKRAAADAKRAALEAAVASKRAAAEGSAPEVNCCVSCKKALDPNAIEAIKCKKCGKLVHGRHPCSSRKVCTACK